MKTQTAIATGITTGGWVGNEFSADSIRTFGVETPDPWVLVWGRRVWSHLAAKWCREFHRQHHAISGLDSLRSKAHCTRCGQKFLLERRVLLL
jgi:hypothetical protein